MAIFRKTVNVSDKKATNLFRSLKEDTIVTVTGKVSFEDETEENVTDWFTILEDYISTPNLTITLDFSRVIGDEDDLLGVLSRSFGNSSRGTRIELIIPNTMTRFALQNHEYVKKIILSNNITEIRSWAFVNCPNLEAITIPNTVNNIEWAAFDKCKSLKTVYYHGTKEQWEKIKIGKDENEALLNAEIKFLPQNKTTIVSSDGTTKTDLIGTWAFRNGKNTTTLILNSDGTFEYNEDFHFPGPSQVNIGPRGEVWTKEGLESKGNWSILNGNILRCEFTWVWKNLPSNIHEGYTTNREVRPITEDEILIGNTTVKRQ